MTKVKVESRRDYELHVKRTVARMQVSSKHKAIFRKIALQCFDDGVAMCQNKLEVAIKENNGN